MRPLTSIKQYRAIVLGRLTFCSMDCLANALEGDIETDQRVIYVSDVIGRALACYGCGLYLDEVAP